MEVVQDGRTNNYQNFQDKLINATIRFSMKRESDGVQKIFMNNAFITEKLLNNPDTPKEYYIYYKWTSRDTNEKGRFIGEFSISNDEGEYILPLSDKLYINIS